jgi:predicted DNA-binding protein (MmcQ/YjbR family)
MRFAKTARLWYDAKKTREVRLMPSVKEQIFAYVREQYGVEPDYPFSVAPEYPVLRHTGSRKWFALLMDVPREKLGLGGAERVDVINLKCDAMSGALRMQPGILPAYHMHRDSWITVLLDGTVADDEILSLIDSAFNETGIKGRKR